MVEYALDIMKNFNVKILDSYEFYKVIEMAMAAIIINMAATPLFTFENVLNIINKHLRVPKRF